MVIYVVKAAFVPFLATGGNPTNAGAARLCGVSPHPIPDTATALPKLALYQTELRPDTEVLYSILSRIAIKISGRLRETVGFTMMCSRQPVVR